MGWHCRRELSRSFRHSAPLPGGIANLGSRVDNNADKVASFARQVALAIIVEDDRKGEGGADSFDLRLLGINAPTQPISSSARAGGRSCSPMWKWLLKHVGD
jgi:hypothetical protein